MLFAVHEDALYEMLVTQVQDPHDAVFSHSRIVTSDLLLDYFDARFSASTAELDLLRALIGRLGAVGRLKHIADVVGAANLHQYENAGYAGGKNLVLESAGSVSVADRQVLSGRGCRLLNPAAISYPGSKIGFEPFEFYTLAHNGRRSPSILAHLFAGATRVVLYDKFFNLRSAALVVNVCLGTRPDAEIVIVTSNHANGLDRTQIRAAVRGLGARRLSVEFADALTTETFHDRFIYVDDHYEVHIPRGLDCFGTGPGWRNSNAQIYVYDCFRATPIKLVCKPHGGRAATRTIELRSCLVA